MSLTSLFCIRITGCRYVAWGSPSPDCDASDEVGVGAHAILAKECLGGEKFVCVAELVGKGLELADDVKGCCVVFEV